MFDATTWQVLLIVIAALVATQALARLMLVRTRELERKIRNDLESELTKQKAESKSKPRDAA